MSAIKREYHAEQDDLFAMSFSGIEVSIKHFEANDWAPVLDLNEPVGCLTSPVETYVALALSIRPTRLIHALGDSSHADVVMKVLEELGVAALTNRTEVCDMLMLNAEEEARDDEHRKGLFKRIVHDGILGGGMQESDYSQPMVPAA